jgi:succinate dehydrogenase / fumarate reductase cytochrome b subunit
MIPLREALGSSVGKKYLMSVSGLAMVGFVVTHLLGNLQLYLPDGTLFNQYAKQLHDLGPLLWVAEIALIGILVLHVLVAFGLTMTNKAARASYQAPHQSKGHPSYASPASKNMIVTGVVLLGFLVVHVLHMKFGVFDGAFDPGTVTIKGEEALNLHARVVNAFKNPAWVAFYMVVMVGLGAHLRHGFWSAFQSLGALNERLEKPAVALGLGVGIALAVGFLGIPPYIMLTAQAPESAAVVAAEPGEAPAAAASEGAQ